MSRWADSTDDEDDYLHEGDHEDYVEHAVAADEVSTVLVMMLYFESDEYPDQTL